MDQLLVNYSHIIYLVIKVKNNGSLLMKATDDWENHPLLCKKLLILNPPSQSDPYNLDWANFLVERERRGEF